MSLPQAGRITRRSDVGIAGCASAWRSYIVLVKVARRGRRGGLRRAGSRGRAFLEFRNLISLALYHFVPIVVWAITSGDVRRAPGLSSPPGSAMPSTVSWPKLPHDERSWSLPRTLLAEKADRSRSMWCLITGASGDLVVILVAPREIMIISGLHAARPVGKPMPIRPLLVSKANTVAQICPRPWRWPSMVLASMPNSS